MTSTEFSFQINRLKSRFGPKAFDDEFTKLIWSEVHNLHSSTLTNAVNSMLGRRRPSDPPLLDDFKSITRHQEAPSTQAFGDAFCADCKGRGYFFGKDDKEFEYAFRCDCSSGSQYNAFSRFNFDHRENFTLTRR